MAVLASIASVVIPAPAAAQWFCTGTEYECSYRNWGRKICAADGGTAVVTFAGKASTCVCANTQFGPHSCEQAYQRQKARHDQQQRQQQQRAQSRQQTPATPRATQQNVTPGGLKIIKPSRWLTSTMYSHTEVECPDNPSGNPNTLARLMHEHRLFRRPFDHRCFMECDPGYKRLYKGCEKI